MNDNSYLISTLNKAKFHCLNDEGFCIIISDSAKMLKDDLTLFLSIDELKDKINSNIIGEIFSVWTLEGDLIIDFNFNGYFYDNKQDVHCYVSSPELKKIFTISHSQIKDRRL